MAYPAVADPKYYNPSLVPSGQPVFDINSNTQPYVAQRNSIVPVVDVGFPRPDSNPSGTFSHALYYDGTCGVFRLV